MKITCISASNVEMAKENSASTRACLIIRDILWQRYDPQIEVKIIPLLDYEFTPCRMCGSCFDLGECVRDDAFNAVYNQMASSDGIFLVCPHYAPLPSKVMMLMEKMEEMAFLNWCADPHYRTPLYKKPAGIIAHGGQPETALAYYKTALLDPLAGALASIQMDVVGMDEHWPSGITFGITNIKPRPGSIFVDIEHDWEKIRLRLLPYVDNFMSRLGKQSV